MGSNCDRLHGVSYLCQIWMEYDNTAIATVHRNVVVSWFIGRHRLHIS